MPSKCYVSVLFFLYHSQRILDFTSMAAYSIYNVHGSKYRSKRTLRYLCCIIYHNGYLVAILARKGCYEIVGLTERRVDDGQSRLINNSKPKSIYYQSISNEGGFI